MTISPATALVAALIAFAIGVVIWAEWLRRRVAKVENEFDLEELKEAHAEAEVQAAELPDRSLDVALDEALKGEIDERTRKP